jgi:hypothetical protein
MGERATSNPVLEILDSHTTAIGCATCSAFYDEHVLLGCPAPVDATGKYRWRFHGRYVSIPQTVMARLCEQATLLELFDTPDAYDNWAYLEFIRAAGRQVQPFEISLPFRLGEVNRFDAPIDPRQELIGLYWYFSPQPYGRVTWDRDATALLMEGRDTRADLSSAPCGPSIRLHDGKALRFSARVQTELEPGAAAWLELDAFLWSPAEVEQPTRSPGATGRNRGDRLEVTLAPGSGKDYVRVALRLEGKGRAWFDEVTLIEL